MRLAGRKEEGGKRKDKAATLAWRRVTVFGGRSSSTLRTASRKTVVQELVLVFVHESGDPLGLLLPKAAQDL